MAKVFVSATTRDLKSYRLVVTEWAKESGHDVVVQDDFPVMSDYGTIVNMLREKLDPCDAVIHLAGLFYGFEPNNRPDGETRRSYTQLEFELGKEYKRQVFRFIAREDFSADRTLEQIETQLMQQLPGLSRDEFQKQCDLQRNHRRRLMAGSEAWSPTARTTGNELYYEFSNHEELRKLLDKIEIKQTLAKPNNLPIVGTLFKGRDDFLEQLRKVLDNKPTHIAVVTAKQAIHGLGGVGKTRVAVEYAKRYTHHYAATLFITADSPANLQRNLANLCGAMVLNLPEKDALKQEEQVAAAVRWLREHSAWFLIIDNVDSPEAAIEVENLLQRLDTGHVVITSRLSNWGDAVEELSLEVMSEAAAKEFLLARTQGRRKLADTDEGDASALAKDLGCLPLALEQAGAYMVKHRGTIADYHARWKSLEKKVLEWHDLRSMKYPASVATTWKTSFDQLTANGHGLMNVLCWMAPDPIPITLINKLSAIDDAPIDVEDGIADLAEYSLLKWTDQHQESVTVHCLVQEILRARQTEPGNYLQPVLRLLETAIPEDDPSDCRIWKNWEPLRSHVAFCAIEASKRGIAAPTAVLLNQLALFLIRKAVYSEAELLLRQALILNRGRFGEVHIEIAHNQNNLGAVLIHTDRYAEAASLFESSLHIILTVYSNDESKAVPELNNLAYCKQMLGEFDVAERLYKRVLALLENEGDDKVAIVDTSINLASLMTEQDRYFEAEPLMRRAVSVLEEVYGKKNDHYSLAVSNLAQIQKSTNRLDDAEANMRLTLEIDSELFGEKHPRVATGHLNLGQLFRARKEHNSAEEHLQIALNIFESHNPASANTALACGALGALLHDSRRFDEAEKLYNRQLQINETIFGPRHSNVANTLSSIGKLLTETRRAKEAEKLLLRAMDIDIECFGSANLAVANDRMNLASCLAELPNREKQAKSNASRALRSYVKFKFNNKRAHIHMSAIESRFRHVLRRIGMKDTKIDSLITLILRAES